MTDAERQTVIDNAAMAAVLPSLLTVAEECVDLLDALIDTNPIALIAHMDRVERIRNASRAATATLKSLNVI